MKIIITIIAILLGVYLIWPSPKFPPAPPGSLQSLEPADTESIYRLGYYTNLTRPEIMAWYDQNYPGPIHYRLDLPPEDSSTVIRDQTRTSYLEQIIHPWRDSLYINVFVPTLPTEQINRNGIHYLNKVIVRQIPSRPITRLTVLLLTSIVTYLLLKHYSHV